MRDETGPPPAPLPSVGEAARLWAHIGLTSFGGAAAQIAMSHKALVAGLLIFRFRRGVVETVAAMAGLGAAWNLAAGR